MSNEITAERLERALALAAYLVVRDGAVALPLFDRLARELAELRQQTSRPGPAGAAAV